MLDVGLKRAWGAEFGFIRNVTKETLIHVIEYNGLPCRTPDYEHTPIDGREWVVKRDGSCGWEIATPRLEPEMRQLDLSCKVLGELRSVGASVDRRCGLHLSYDMVDTSEMAMTRVIYWWIRLEGFLMLGLPRTRRGNPFCLPQSDACGCHEGMEIRPESLLHLASQDRYRSLNIAPWMRERRRIEVRIMEATNDPISFSNSALFFSHIIESSVRQKMKDSYKLFNVKEAVEFLGWEPGADLSPRMNQIRLWWLTRIKKFSGLAGKKSKHVYEAKRIIDELYKEKGS